MGKSSASVGSQRITLDYNNCLAEVVGNPHGLKQTEIDRIDRLAPKIAERLQAARKAGKLPYRDLPYQDQLVADVLRSAREKKGRFDNVVVLGIGGSALGTIAVHTACAHPFYNMLPDNQRKGPRLFVMDNVDAAQFGALLDMIDLRKTLIITISKSGSTAETMSQFLICRQKLIDAVGIKKHAEQMVVITDREKGYLRPIAQEAGYETFPVPDGVGGRFSVFSAVGLLPLALAGIDIKNLMAGAALMDGACTETRLRRNPAFMSAAIQMLYYNRGKPMSVMMPYSQSLRDVADWYRQLWAESLGKVRTGAGGRTENVGPTPIKALGVTDQHSQVQLYREGPNDKIFTLLAVGNFGRTIEIPKAFETVEGVGYLGGHTMNELMDAERRATAFALVKSERPNVTINLPVVNEFTVGQLLYMLEVQTSFAGELLKINTYDQPGVEEGKIATYALMGRKGFAEARKEIKALKSSRKYVI